MAGFVTSSLRPVPLLMASCLDGMEHRHVDTFLPVHSAIPSEAESSWTTLDICDGGPETIQLLPDVSTPFLMAAVALILLITAQSFINQMLEGDQGLGAFLRDGSGYKKSGFRVKKGKDAGNMVADPLPWLKLPRLDYVDVAGQPALVEDEAETAAAASVIQQLEQLRLRMNRELQEENFEEATRIRKELETLMQDQGIDFTTETTT